MGNRFRQDGSEQNSGHTGANEATNPARDMLVQNLRGMNYEQQQAAIQPPMPVMFSGGQAVQFDPDEAGGGEQTGSAECRSGYEDDEDAACSVSELLRSLDPATFRDVASAYVDYGEYIDGIYQIRDAGLEELSDDLSDNERRPLPTGALVSAVAGYASAALTSLLVVASYPVSGVLATWIVGAAALAPNEEQAESIRRSARAIARPIGATLRRALGDAVDLFLGATPAALAGEAELDLSSFISRLSIAMTQSALTERCEILRGVTESENPLIAGELVLAMVRNAVQVEAIPIKTAMRQFGLDLWLSGLRNAQRNSMASSFGMPTDADGNPTLLSPEAESLLLTTGEIYLQPITPWHASANGFASPANLRLNNSEVRGLSRDHEDYEKLWLLFADRPLGEIQLPIRLSFLGGTTCDAGTVFLRPDGSRNWTTSLEPGLSALGLARNPRLERAEAIENGVELLVSSLSGFTMRDLGAEP